MCTEYRHNALVICNHAPDPGVGGVAMEMSGALASFATAVQEKYPGFALYRQNGP